MRANGVRRVRATLAGLGLMAALASPAAADTYKIDGVHSVVLFRIKHMNVSYTYGRFNDVAGSVTLDDPDPAKSALAIEIKADSVDTHNEKRDKHLRSPDFFNAKEFPAITFKSTAVRKTGDDAYEVTGDLSLHGVTKSVTIPFKRTGTGPGMQGETRAGGEAVFTVKRSDYGMSYMLNAVGDEVTLTVSLEGVKE